MFVALLFLIVLVTQPAVAQTPAGSSDTSPAAPSGPPPTGASGPSPAAPGAPTAPPFVPPVPPAPSQSHIPEVSAPSLPPTPVAAFEFHPTGLLREEYSDNFFLSPGRGKKNFRTTVGAGFNLLLNTGKTQGSVTTGLDVAYDTVDTSQHEHLFPSGAVSITHTPNPRLKLTLTDALSSGDEASRSDQFGIRAPERREFISNAFGLSADWLIDTIATQGYYRQSTVLGSSASGTSQNLSNTAFSHVFGLNASAPIATNNTVRVGYELSLTQGSASQGSGQHTADSTGHLFLASFSRQLSQFASAGISTSYSVQSLDNSRIWNTSLFTAYGLPTGLSVSSSIGYSLFSADNTRDTSGVSTNTTVGYQFGQAIASLSIFQDFRQTFVQGENVGVVMTRTVTAALAFPITAATGATLTASYSENEPTGSGNNRSQPTTTFLSGTASIASSFFTTGVRASRGENQIVGPINAPTGHAGETIQFGAFLGFPLGRWFSLNFDYNHLSEGGTGGGPDTVENRATVSLQASF